MRIVRNGLEETETICVECGSILAYVQKDIYCTEIEIMGLIGIDKCIKCPICGNEIIVETIYHSIR